MRCQNKTDSHWSQELSLIFTVWFFFCSLLDDITGTFADKNCLTNCLVHWCKQREKKLGKKKYTCSHLCRASLFSLRVFVCACVCLCVRQKHLWKFFSQGEWKEYLHISSFFSLSLSVWIRSQESQIVSRERSAFMIRNLSWKENINNAVQILISHENRHKNVFSVGKVNVTWACTNGTLGKTHASWSAALFSEGDKIVDLWRRKCRCDAAHNAFIPHYVASIQYSEHDLGKQPGMQSRMNEQDKKLKQELLWVTRSSLCSWRKLCTFT